jgi:elongation factor P
MLIPATQLRVGMLINYQNDLYRIMAVTHVTPGNWRGMVQTKMRSVRSGTQTENRFRSEDKVDRVTLDQQQMEFLYAEGVDFHFMNTETFEQISLDREMLGEVVSYLLPNLRVTVDFYEGRPIGVSLPKTVDLRVTDTAPGLKTATVTNVLKPATTETGLVVPVPNFVDTDDVIRVDTESGAYLSRVKGD